jgi:hypothetical protein
MPDNAPLAPPAVGEWKTDFSKHPVFQTRRAAS